MKEIGYHINIYIIESNQGLMFLLASLRSYFLESGCALHLNSACDYSFTIALTAGEDKR